MKLKPTTKTHHLWTLERKLHIFSFKLQRVLPQNPGRFEAKAAGNAVQWTPQRKATNEAHENLTFTL